MNAMLEDRKQLHIDTLKNNEYEDSKTHISSDGFAKSEKQRKKSRYISKEKIEKLDTYERYKLQNEAYKNDEIFCVEKNPSELDYKLFEIIYEKQVMPLFFEKADSSALKVMTPKNFFKRRQYSANYFMPVTVKSFKERKVTGRTITETNKEGVTEKFASARSFVDTSRDNINGVLEVVIDIDFHNEEERLEFEELEQFAHSVNYFSTEANTQPTAIVVTGNGIQLHYVLEEPVYRNNAKAIDKLLKAFYKTLKNVINNKVLSQIALSENTKCDEALNPINQKVRVPGTYNFSANNYAHTVILNEDTKYNMSNFLSENLGDYEEYKENQAAIQKEKSKKSNYRGNNGNGTKNIQRTLNRRIIDIESAMYYSSKHIKTGFRNDGFFCLIWQLLNLADYDKRLNKVKIANRVFEISDKLDVPYFKSIRQARNLVDSVERTMEKSNNRWMTNSSIEDKCIALQYANNKGFDFDIFFKESVESRREKQIEANREKKTNCIAKIKQMVSNGITNISRMARELEIARNTFYAYIKEILSDAGIQIKNLVDCIIKLRNYLRKISSQEVISRSNTEDLSLPSKYILFNTENLNNLTGKIAKIKGFISKKIKNLIKLPDKQKLNTNMQVCPQN